MYNKLFSKILDSSIWMEPPGTRLVWLTFLAAMDQDGFAVFASIANLAHRARVTVEECTVAVACLESADPNSSNPDHEGRRIERVPGGWIIINSKVYQDLVTRAIARDQNRARVARHRKKKALLNAASNGGVMEAQHVGNGASENVMQSDSDSDAYSETDSDLRAHAVRRSADTVENQDDIIGSVMPQPLPGHGRAAPADLSADLRPLWLEIAKDHGPEVATKARDATKRIFGAVTPARMRETFGEAYERKALELPADDWPDFRQRIKNDRAGLTNNAATDVDPAREAARRKRIAQIHGDANER